MEKARQAIASYINREFRLDSDPEVRAEDVNLGAEGIGYTTTEDECHDIQWYASLRDKSVWLEVDDHAAYRIEFNDHDEMAQWFDFTSFDELASDAELWIAEH